jgi:hypothetical protein
MSNVVLNPYQPPFVERKLTPSEAADVRHRDIAVFILLSVVTLGLYWFYVSYHWSKEINGLTGRVKYHPLLVLVTNIVTCGICGMVFECLFAFDIAERTRTRGIKGRLENLPTWVIATNCAGLALSLIPFGVVVGLPLCILASVLVQVELNRLAQP